MSERDPFLRYTYRLPASRAKHVTLNDRIEIVLPPQAIDALQALEGDELRIDISRLVARGDIRSTVGSPRTIELEVFVEDVRVENDDELTRRYIMNDRGDAIDVS